MDNKVHIPNLIRSAEFIINEHTEQKYVYNKKTNKMVKVELPRCIVKYDTDLSDEAKMEKVMFSSRIHASSRKDNPDNGPQCPCKWCVLYESEIEKEIKNLPKGRPYEGCIGQPPPKN